MITWRFRAAAANVGASYLWPCPWILARPARDDPRLQTAFGETQQPAGAFQKCLTDVGACRRVQGDETPRAVLASHMSAQVPVPDGARASTDGAFLDMRRFRGLPAAESVEYAGCGCCVFRHQCLTGWHGQTPFLTEDVESQTRTIRGKRTTRRDQREGKKVRKTAKEWAGGEMPIPRRLTKRIRTGQRQGSRGSSRETG